MCALMVDSLFIKVTANVCSYVDAIAPLACTLHSVVCSFVCWGGREQHAERHKFYVVDMARWLIFVHPSVFISVLNCNSTVANVICLYFGIHCIFSTSFPSFACHEMQVRAHMHGWTKHGKLHQIPSNILDHQPAAAVTTTSVPNNCTNEQPINGQFGRVGVICCCTAACFSFLIQTPNRKLPVRFFIQIAHILIMPESSNANHLRLIFYTKNSLCRRNEWHSFQTGASVWWQCMMFVLESSLTKQTN